MNVKVEVEISKEASDVGDLLKTLVQDIKDKKSVSEIAADGLPKLMAAMQGLGDVANEIKDKEVFARTMGMKFGEIVSLFI